MLPGADGLTVCREVRSAYKNPILMLTARTDDMDQVGLEMGADDYVNETGETPRVAGTDSRLVAPGKPTANETTHRAPGNLVPW